MIGFSPIPRGGVILEDMLLLAALLLQDPPLERKISIDARGSFRELLETLRQSSGANVLVLPKTPIPARGHELILKDVRARTAFRWLAAAYGVEVRERDNVLIFGTLVETAPLVMRLHEARGVLAPLSDHRGPSLSLPGPNPLHLQLEPPEQNRLSDRSEMIVDLLKENVAPGSWEGDATIERTPEERLLIRHRAEVHEDVRWLLDVLRRFAPTAVDVSLEVAELDAPGPPILGPAEADVLSARLRAAGGRTLRASCLNTQRAHALVNEEGPVLAGYLNGVPQFRKAPLQARVLDARPTLVDGGERAIVDLELSIGRTSGAETPAREASLTRLRTSLLVPRGGGARILLPGSLVALVRASWSGGAPVKPQSARPLQAPSPLFERLDALPAGDVDLPNVPVPELAAWLRRVSGLNVAVSPAAAALRVELRAKNVKPAAALRILLDAHGLRAAGDDEVLGLSTRRESERGEVRTLLFDARAAAYNLPRWKPHDGAAFTGEDIANLLKNTVHREHWEEADGKSIQFVDGLVLARNTDDVLRDCVAFLDAHSRPARAALAFHVDLLTIDATAAERVEALVDAAARTKLLDGARVDSAAWCGWAGQDLSLAWERSRTHAWDVDGDDPLLRGQLMSSFLELEATPEADGPVQVALRFKEQLLRGIERRGRTEHPLVDSLSTTTSLRIPPGRWAALRFGLAEPGKVRLLLLSATPLP